MDAIKYDTKMFYKLMKKQCARPSTATEILQYDGNIFQVRRRLQLGLLLILRTLPRRLLMITLMRTIIDRFSMIPWRLRTYVAGSLVGLSSL